MTLTAEGVREWPILMSGPLVLACLKDLKTVTRRVPVARWKNLQVGDRLWVRETWCLAADPMTSKLTGGFLYRADPTEAEVMLDDGDGDGVVNKDGAFASPWRPSIFMPRAACRLVLEVTSHRVERLMKITFKGIRAEGKDCPTHDFPGGFCCSECPSLRAAFYEGWNGLNAARGYGWEKNPEVKVIEFRRVP